jgi:hypothetical protein
MAWAREPLKMPGVSISSLMLQPSKTNTRHVRPVRPHGPHVAGGTFEFRRLDMFDVELSTWHHHSSAPLAMEEHGKALLKCFNTNKVCRQR